MCDAYAQRHAFVLAALNEIDGVDCRPGEGTFYAFPRVAQCLERLQLTDDVALAELLLNEADVACVPGSAFGAPGYLRISFATAQAQLEEAMRRIRRVLGT